jgi:hypothetical protein
VDSEELLAARNILAPISNPPEVRNLPAIKKKGGTKPPSHNKKAFGRKRPPVSKNQRKTEQEQEVRHQGS